MIYKTPPRFKNAKWEDVPERLRALMGTIKETRKGVYLHGPVGTGKTHILHAIAKHVVESQNIRVRYHNTVEMLREIKSDFDRHYSAKKHILEDVLGYPGLLILDDIGAEKLSEYVSETFYLIVNKRYEEMLPVIFSSNYDLEQLSERIGDRTASRIVQMSEIVLLNGTDRRLSPESKNSI